jgi:hypothetical protein
MDSGTCAVRETPDEILARIEAAAGGWFSATADPEGDTIWLNARQLHYIGRERTSEELQEAREQ